MKQPHTEPRPTEREITGEIVYLDEMRRQNTYPETYQALGDTVIRAYEAHAEAYKDGDRPVIMDAYEEFDKQPSKAVENCMALADELLALKAPDSMCAFVDLMVQESPKAVLSKVKATPAGKVIAVDDKQLAIPSNGEYYPILDFKKQHAQLVGVGLRVWGWDNEKHIFTNKKGEPYEFPRHVLIYPADEKSRHRRLEISFNYSNAQKESFSESVALDLYSDGSTELSSNIVAAAYVETGYEGHGGSHKKKVSEASVAAFGDLVAHIVGDEPESIHGYIDRRINGVLTAAASAEAQKAVEDLVDATWPAQAHYILFSKLKGTGATLSEQLSSADTADTAIKTIQSIITAEQSR